MFLNNKYNKWYYTIIKNAQNRTLDSSVYVEKHHIIPKCMGGLDDQTNIAILTAREHFVCHRILIKMVDNLYYKRKMEHALGKFVQENNKQLRNLNSRQYEVARKAISTARKGRTHSIETRQKLSDSHKGKPSLTKGRRGMFTHTTSAKEKISNAVKGKSFVERFGEDRAAEIINSIKSSKKGKPSGMLGKKHSEETIKKLSKPKKGSPHIKTTCPHCASLEKTPRHIKFCAKKHEV